MKGYTKAVIVLALVGICMQGKANAQSEEYQTEFNACFDGENAEYCHCTVGQTVNRSADAIFAIQYCLESIRGIKATQSDILDYITRSELLQKNTEVCTALARQQLPQYAGQVSDYCSCLTRKAFLERQRRNVALESCSSETGIPW